MSIHCLKYWFLLCAHVVQYTVEQLFFFLVWTTNAVLLTSVRKKCCSKFPRIIGPSTIVIHKFIYQFTSAGSFLDKKPAKKCVITKKQQCPLPHCKSRIELEYFSWYLNLCLTLRHVEILKCTGWHRVLMFITFCSLQESLVWHME